MSEFLTKKQADELKEYDWKLIDTESGIAWFGANWTDGWLSNVTDLLPDLPDDDGGEGTGMDFLIVAYRPTSNEDDSEKNE